jgi:small-conductance mechanosensitive channel
VIVLRLVQRVSFGRLANLAKRTKTVWDDVIVGALAKTKLLFLIAVGVRVAAGIWVPEGRVGGWVHVGFILVLLWQAGVWLSAGVRLGLDAFREERGSDDPGAVTTVSALGFVIQLAVWSIVTLLALDNVGIEITTLVAGLGVGGIAVALAVQNILGDLFASLSIVLDKPFVIGDFVEVGGYFGTVENVGLKTTRLRSISGEQLIFSNNDLLQSRLRNYGRMFERRVVFSIGVTYQTPKELLEEIPGIIQGLVERQERTRFDRAHFKEFGDSALTFECAY